MRQTLRFAACLALVLFVLHAQAQTADPALQQVIADYERLQRQTDPISAGAEGDREALRRLPDAWRLEILDIRGASIAGRHSCRSNDH